MNSWGCSVIACKSFRVRNELLSPLGSVARNHSTSHTSESGMQADSHSKFVLLRDLGEDWIVCMRKLR